MSYWKSVFVSKAAPCLQVKEALTSMNFDETWLKPIITIIKSNESFLRETLIENQHFNLYHITREYRFMTGKTSNIKSIGMYLR